MLHQQVYVGVAIPQFQHKAAWEAAYSNKSKWGWGRWKWTSGWWWEAGAHSILGDTILSYCISPRGPELGERKSIDGCYAHAPLSLSIVGVPQLRQGKKDWFHSSPSCQITHRENSRVYSRVDKLWLWVSHFQGTVDWGLFCLCISWQSIVFNMTL